MNICGKTRLKPDVSLKRRLDDTDLILQLRAREASKLMHMGHYSFVQIPLALWSSLATKSL